MSLMTSPIGTLSAMVRNCSSRSASAPFGGPTLAEIAHVGEENRATAALALHDDEIDWEDRAVSVHCIDLDPSVEDVGGPRGDFTGAASSGGEIAYIGRHHQLGYRPADGLRARMAESALCGGVELDDPALLVSGDVAVERRFQRRQPQPLSLFAR